MRTLLIIVSIFIFIIGDNAHSAEETTAPSNIEQTVKKSNTPSFNVANNLLEKFTGADQISTIDVNGNIHLVLEYLSKGRKKRGNVLFFHAEGESPVNNRLIQPLAKQLTNLGWNIYIPNIAKEDYPKINQATENIAKETNQQQVNKSDDETNTTVQTESSSNEISEQSNHFYFEDEIAYQNYYIELCKAIYQQTKIEEQATIIITNQNSAYWGIDCLAISGKNTPMVFLNPLLPFLSKNTIEEKFAKQTSPVFSFMLNNSDKEPFTIALKKRIWLTKFQRSNVSMLNSTKLDFEDSSVARSITGWIEKLRQK